MLWADVVWLYTVSFLPQPNNQDLPSFLSVLPHLMCTATVCCKSVNVHLYCPQVEEQTIGAQNVARVTQVVSGAVIWSRPYESGSGKGRSRWPMVDEVPAPPNADSRTAHCIHHHQLLSHQLLTEGMDGMLLNDVLSGAL